MDPDGAKTDRVSGIRTLSFLKKTSSKSKLNTGTSRKSKNDLDQPFAYRRFIAEDPTFNPDKVPSLEELVLRQIIENFSFNYSAISYLNEVQLRRVIDALSTDIPLKVVSPAISDESFWQRMTLCRWPVVDVVRHGNSWKRAFFEKYLEQTIHEYVPGHTYPIWIDEALEFGAPYIQRIDIREMLPQSKSFKSREGRRISLPPTQSKPERAAHQFVLHPSYSDDVSENILDFDDDLDDALLNVEGKLEDEEETEFTQVDHLDLSRVIEKLDRLTHLSVQYRVRNVGLDFEWSQFQFTGRDCISFSKAVKCHKTLRILELTNSRVDCQKCRVLVGHLLDHPSLIVLNLSHNIISDWGARALSKLINGRSKLECLDLTDNRVNSEGGEVLSHALAKDNGTLMKLNLRLNHIRDPGACSIAKSLLRNTTLRELNLAANRIGDPSIYIFGQVLPHNSTLQKLDLSNNSISEEAGKIFQECIASNQSLIHLDLRFTGMPQVFEYTLQQNVEFNDNRHRLRPEKDTEPGCVSMPGLINVAVNELTPVPEKIKPRPQFFT